MLGLDWQQILLHIFNFSLLALVLNILLYKPILDFVEKREKLYADMEEKTKNNLAESEKSLLINKEKLKNIHIEAEKIKSQALEKGKLQAAHEIELAKQEAERITKDSKLEAERERDNLIRNTKKDIKQVIVEAATKLAYVNNNAYDDFLEHAKEENHE